jgi:ABC-type Fe3+ transport system permease subunit
MRQSLRIAFAAAATVGMVVGGFGFASALGSTPGRRAMTVSSSNGSSCPGARYARTC